MREPETAIPSDELLFRWLSTGDVDGTVVLPTAVDLQGTSVDRQRYFKPRACQSDAHPERNGLASISEDAFPRGESANGVVFEYFTHDCPEHDNHAHAEIRVGRLTTPEGSKSDRPEGFKPKGQAVKVQLRLSLAACMKVERCPIP